MFLFKYFPLEAGVHALSKREVLWQNPNASMDPYKVNARTSLRFDQEALQNAVIKALLRMIFAPNDPQGAPDHPIRRVVMRWRSQDRFSNEEEAEESLREMTRSMTSTHYERVLEYHKKWINILSRQRVLELSECADSLHTWDDWADAHRGMALRLSVGEACVSANAHKVKYQSVPNSITSLSEQVQVVIGERAFPQDDMETLTERCLSENPEYSYRKAWRCFRYVDDPRLDLTLPLMEEDLSAVLLGLCVSSSARQEVMAVLKRAFPKVKLYAAVRDETTYGVKFKGVREGL